MKDERDARFKVYISRAAEDAAQAEELYKFMRDALGPYNDLRIYGSRSGIQTVTAVRTCDAFVLLVSRNTFTHNESIAEPVNNEYAEARNFKRNMVCVFLENGLAEKIIKLPDATIFPEARGGINFPKLLEALGRCGAALAPAKKAPPPAGGHEVFLCFKHLDEDGSRTRDSMLAQELYEFMTGKELAVFFSEQTLEDMGIASYKAAIDEALDNAQVVVVVGTSPEHMNAKWVRYEWDSFYNDILNDIKPRGRIFTYVDGVADRKLPRTLRQMQCIKHGPGSFDRLFRFVANALGSSLPLREKDENGEVPLRKKDEENTGSGERAVEKDISVLGEASRFMRIGDFLIERDELLRNTNWLAAQEHALKLSMRPEVNLYLSIREFSQGQNLAWKLPPLEQLKAIRKAAIFPEKYCYWSREEAGDDEARYLHFDDGHAGTGPKSFDNGLCAVFVVDLKQAAKKPYSPSEAGPDILSKLLSEHQETVVNTFSAIEREHRDDYCRELVRRLSSASSSEKVAALQALYWVRYKALPAYLMTLAKDESVAVRRRAAHYLGLLRYKNALGVITELCQDKSPDVRAEARSAYGKLTGKRLASGDGIGGR